MRKMSLSNYKSALAARDKLGFSLVEEAFEALRSKPNGIDVCDWVFTFDLKTHGFRFTLRADPTIYFYICPVKGITYAVDFHLPTHSPTS